LLCSSLQMFHTKPRKFCCVFDDGKDYTLEMALKKNRFKFILSIPSTNERIDADGVLVKKSQTQYTLQHANIMHSKFVGFENEKQIDMIVQKEDDELEPFTCQIGNGFYGIPFAKSEWSVVFENDDYKTLTLKWRLPSCTVRFGKDKEQIGDYNPGEEQEITLWYSK